MKDPRIPRTSGTQGARGQGSYVPQACSVCRHKKIKCDGAKPCCETCTNHGRESECSYGKEVGRRPRTEAHFQAMQKRIETLREYIHHLESLLDRCQKEHTSSTAYTYQQFRPVDFDESPGSQSPDEVLIEIPEDEEEKNSGGGGVADELCLPTQKLKLAGGGGLLLHGAPSPFRYIPEPARPQHSVAPIWAISDINPNESYILLADGTDESHFNPNFDWSRHLPSEVRLDRREHDKVLDLVFKFFTSWCLRVVPTLFLRDMYRALSVPKNQPVPHQPHYSPMLHNAILALGTGFSDDPAIRNLKSRTYFLEKAKSYIEEECSKPRLCVVQALSLIGGFHSSQGDQTLGYVFFGMGARVSQALGLGVDCSSWVESGYITAEDQADRNWAYWSTFCQDVCWSLYVGRDFCVPETPKRVALPLIDVDFDKMDWVYRPAGTQPQPGYEATTFKASCELLMIARTIMDVVTALDCTGNQQLVLGPKVSEINLALHQWNSNLPEVLRNTVRMRSNPTPHLLQLHLTYHWSFIILHRPFCSRRPNRAAITKDDVSYHVKTCKRASDAIMELMHVWRQHFTLRYAPVQLVQPVFCAGTIYLLSALQAVDGARIAMKELRHAMNNARLCINYLKEIGDLWPCGTKIANILNDWLQMDVRPKIGGRSSISPVPYNTAPQKKQVSQHTWTNETGFTQGERGKTGATPAPKIRQRSLSANEASRDLDGGNSRRSTGGVTLRASFQPSSGSGTTVVSPPVRNSPPNQTLEMAGPLSTAPPPHAQPPFHLGAPSPQSLQHRSSFSSHPTLPTLNTTQVSQHLRVHPAQSFIPVPPQPQQWTTVLVEGEPTGLHPHSISTAEQPTAPILERSLSQPVPRHQPQQYPHYPQHQRNQPNTNSFNANDNTDTPMSSSTPTPSLNFTPQSQSVFPNYQSWTVDAFPPVGPPALTTSTKRNTKGGGTRPLSPINYHLAMPNGRRLWEMPVVPFGARPEEDFTGRAPLNLKFEAPGASLRFGEWMGMVSADTNTEQRVREGWEGIEQQDYMNWFGELGDK